MSPGAVRSRASRNPARARFWRVLRKYRGRLPADFRFDRLEKYTSAVEHYRFSTRDALIVAAALDASCSTLYAKYLQDTAGPSKIQPSGIRSAADSYELEWLLQRPATVAGRRLMS